MAMLVHFFVDDQFRGWAGFSNHSSSSRAFSFSADDRVSVC